MPIRVSSHISTTTACYRRIVEPKFALRPLSAFILLALLGSNTNAYAATSTGTVQVAILTAGSIVKKSDLDFGGIIATTAAGTVTVTPAGARTQTGGAILAGSSFSEAIFEGKGSRRNQQIIVTLPTSIQITRVSGTQTMTVDNFTMGTSPTLAAVAAGRRFRIVPADATYEFPVGATLSVGANQTPGSYTGLFTIDVAYQ